MDAVKSIARSIKHFSSFSAMPTTTLTVALPSISSRSTTSTNAIQSAPNLSHVPSHGLLDCS